jgi:hypothetical protein
MDYLYQSIKNTVMVDLIQAPIHCLIRIPDRYLVKYVMRVNSRALYCHEHCFETTLVVRHHTTQMVQGQPVCENRGLQHGVHYSELIARCSVDGKCSDAPHRVLPHDTVSQPRCTTPYRRNWSSSVQAICTAHQHIHHLKFAKTVLRYIIDHMTISSLQRQCREACKGRAARF